MNNPKISIIMSVYNGENYLAQSIESILGQSFNSFEFLIMDDASTDKTSEILKEFSKTDDRIKVYKQKNNIGLPKSLNELIKFSQSDIIARMDADDISINCRLEKQYNYLLRNPIIGVLGCDSVLIDIENNYICKKYRPKSIKKIINSMRYFNYLTHPSIMVRKSVFEKYGFYNENYYTGQDWELWSRYINSNITFEIFPEILLLFRINPKSLSSWQSNNKAGGNLNLALLCLHNNARLDSFKYFFKLSVFEKTTYLLHFMIPFDLFVYLVKIYQLYYPNSVMKRIKRLYI
jgi:glycosyltransferase involved in cell wall biosynthesis